MHSGELADLAGVTVRTIRHYHQIGLLPEPPRSAGGYRDYGVDDVVRLLRITRLAGLGVPLADLPSVLDDPAAAEALLDGLDRQAASEMERLAARRASIAALRDSGAPPDVAPELAGWRSERDEGRGPAAADEHAQLVLASHLLGRGATGGLAAFVGRIGLADAGATALAARFAAIDETTGAAEREAVAALLEAHLRPAIAALDELPPLDTRVSALIAELSDRSLPPAQREVLLAVQARLAD